jgi:hypothetical protein
MWGWQMKTVALIAMIMFRVTIGAMGMQPDRRDLLHGLWAGRRSMEAGR